MESVFTTCEHCAMRFEAPARSAGGLTNCPTCNKATTVPGGSDPLWSAAVGLAFLATVIAVAVAYGTGGPVAAALTLVVCIIVAAALRLSS